MPDREKVIKGLEHCSEDGCKDCPYETDCTMCDGFSLLAKDALTLLKEQEAVRPIKKDTVEITARYGHECPCGAPLLIGQPYCANCGSEVKWE